MKPQSLLSLCSKNRFEILTQNSIVCNDVCDDDLLRNDDCKRIDCLTNVKIYPKYIINKENKLFQNYTCKKIIKDFNVKYMKDDVNKLKEKYLNSINDPQITKNIMVWYIN